ncbi:allantoate amidohydrolase [Massilia yuzhufengensis]|uniref:Allantoate deiminase/N-carbamoyl-L-amino-acid hydrolase n=1 Tax=Massilia yuzhufengensis TaxID=1164594 RepID=A0A1I1FPW0_9BURK|nr:allantoate amidohydrolase [Massilia yuzhufengensis]SFC01374.1 allantoate deiminase/N-carbamoyl-L-amino-acid hydrolase [Massilia yuzhufengensis]
MTTLPHLNTCPPEAFVDTLRGIYEHSPWIAERAAAARPFASPAALKQALQAVVMAASEDEQLALLRVHPELAGKAAIAGELTAESTGEQAASGLNLCSAEEYATLHALNARYKDKFGFPFILAVKGPTGRGLTRAAIIANFTRRLKNLRGDEMAECLRQVHRIAEIRLNELLGVRHLFGPQVMDWAETLGAISDSDADLTCAYMTPAHRRTAAQLADWMRAAGMAVHVDAVGNVVGRYAAAQPEAKTLITGSHYDTVRNGGKYDGRLGILLPIAVVAHLDARGERLPFHLEVIGFAEEEGVRFRSTFLGSSAITGRFKPALLDQQDSEGVTIRDALAAAGHDPSTIGAIARDPASLLGFVEVHIEQGPVLLERGLPVGVVTAIAGSSRYAVELAGVASHAGTTPMGMRRDAAAAAAEIVLLVEGRCSGRGSLVGTVGQLEVPAGSVNVIPGLCRLSLDIRAAVDAERLAAVDDILAGISAICTRRGIEEKLWKLVEADAAPCAPALMDRLGQAIDNAGLPRFDVLSGAGHDAMEMAAITDVAMLFTRCGNGGISHNPLETMTADDAEVAGEVLLGFLRDLGSRA